MHIFVALGNNKTKWQWFYDGFKRLGRFFI